MMRHPAAKGGDAPMTRVLLVREWEGQLSSSGCCGRLEGSFLEPTERECPRPFAARRREMERAGVLYRALRERYGEGVDVRIVDPRNLLSLLPMMLADARRHGRGGLEIVRDLLSLSLSMVVVNGRTVARNRWPAPQEVFAAVDESLRGTTGATVSA